VISDFPITKKTLDEQRKKELNKMDLMHNTSIVYHTESILEVQLMMIIFVITYESAIEVIDSHK